MHRLAMPMQQGMPGSRGQLGPRRVDGEPERPAESLGQPYEVVADVPAAPRRDRALSERLRLVGHDQLRVDLELAAQAGAARARARWRVEGERAGLQLVER